MLDKPFVNAIRRLPSANSPQSCAVCFCRCGSQFLLDAFSTGSKSFNVAAQRRYATQRRSPATLRAERSRRSRVLTPGEMRAVQMDDSDDLLRKVLVSLGLGQRAVDRHVAFANELHQLALTSQVGHAPLDTRDFTKLVERYEDLLDLFVIARILSFVVGQKYKPAARRLLFTLSHLGNTDATLYIMFKAEQMHRGTRRTLDRADLREPRAQLRKMTESPENYQAMTLEGRIAYKLNDENRAIAMLTKAVGPAVEAASTPNKGDDDPSLGLTTPTYTDLDSPWIELANIHSARKEHEKALWAINNGIAADDPVSHYQRTQYEKDPHENVGSTSTWLYHATKAAASGYVKAIHELGIFYYTSGWKYVEDEPPDSIKPTPFDSYPPDGKKMPSFLKALGTTLGVSAPPEDELKRQVFETAIFPATPQMRMQLALGWFQLGINLYFVPSYLSAARLHMEKTLWSGSETPKAALEMTAERYDYASKADFLENSHLEKSSAEPKQDPPNPFYSPEKARELVREIFFAANAQRERQRLLLEEAKFVKPVSRKSFVEDHKTWEGHLKNSYEHVRKWFRYPGIRALCSNDEAGVLFDDAMRLPDLEVEAMDMCDKYQWDLYDDHGGLIYRHGLRAPKSSAGKAKGR